MALSHELLSQFAKLVTKDKKTNVETTVYGTVVVDGNGNKYVKLDGSDQLTPLSDDERPLADSTTANANEGERVSVLIKNHTATVTGNVSSPAARTGDVEDLGDQISEIREFDILIGNQIQANEGYIKQLQTDKANVSDLDAAKAEITDLLAKKATIEQLEATKAEIDDIIADKIDTDVLDAKYATIENLTVVNQKVLDLEGVQAEFQELTAQNFEASNAEIANLKAKDANIDNLLAGKADVSDLEASNAEILNLKAKDVDIENLVAGKASITDLEAVNVEIDNLGTKYANIDFANIGEAAIKKIFSDSGLIKDLIVGSGTITGELVGVTIKGDLIEGNTVKADKLVVKGSDGLYYKLNFDGGNFAEGEQVPTDSLHGSVITAKSITAEKVRVTDLVAFGATIGGFNITQNSLYSGVKSSATNTTRGIYLDNAGQMGIGDATNFIKFYERDGVYKLEISASSLKFSTNNKSVEEILTDIETDVNNISVGGRNLIADTDFGGVSKRYERLESYFSEGGFHFYPTTQIESSVDYTLSMSVRGSANLVLYEINHDPDTGDAKNVSYDWITKDELSTTDYKRFSYTFSVWDDRVLDHIFICTKYGESHTLVGDWFEIEPSSLKLERGNRATDWTPAPEDTANAIEAAQSAAEAAQNTANQNAVDMANIVKGFNADVENLQTQIDGSITTWFYEVAPTDTNEPASAWTTVDLKNNHLGDLYYDTITGYCYRWQVANNTYSWQRITDTDVTKALSDAQSAKDTADQKRRVFYSQPAPPYDAGDLWVQGGNGDILRCQIAKVSGQSYAESDWVKASKYTDDTAADEVKNTLENDYYNKLQTDAAIKVESDAIVASVSATYATKQALDDLEIGGRNLLPDTDFGGESKKRIEPENGTGEGGFNFYPITPIESGKDYTISARVRGTADVVFYEINEGGNISHHWIKKADLSETDYRKFSYTFSVDENRTFKNAYICTKYGSTAVGEWFEIEPSSLKLEKGNKATDWTPALEDMASASDLKSYATKSEVTQTAENITASVNSTMQQKLDGYYTKEQTDAAISVESDSITSSVRKEIEAVQVGARNLLTNSDVELSGGTSEFLKYADLALVFDVHGLVEYTISFDMKSADISQQNTMQVYCQNGSSSKYSIGTHTLPITTEYVRHSITVTPSLNNEAETESYLAFYGNYGTGNIPSVKNVKVERGNKATDWTPAPEDVDNAIGDAQSTANSAGERVAASETLIQQLSNCIATLVVDENGESLMTQTENGWAFSMKQTNDTVSSLSSALNTLQNETGDTKATVNALQQLINDHGQTLEYVNITIYEDEPCIELGESDSDFKLLITNTRIMFMNGANVPTYINTSGLVTENIEVRGEIHQGGWAWVTHGNGNLGLMWKEVIS